MWICSIAGIIGGLIYIPIYYVLIHYLPEECRQSKIFYVILAGIVILFFMTIPLWCYSWPSFLAAAGFSISAAVIITTDWSCCWIPDEPIMLLLIIDGFMLAGQHIIINTMVCAISLFFYLGVYLFFPKGIGSGDIKLAAALCLGCPGQSAYIMTVAAFFSAAAGTFIYRRFRRTNRIPFGPYLLMGWWCASVMGGECIEWLFFT
ncbi:prepilin peptidase [Megasphaera sueciensis]|uniref:prepilin peptidase n=1 Tax=Megasphaera sueciensis TaxID=349094 RepID=UPI003D06F963